MPQMALINFEGELGVELGLELGEALRALGHRVVFLHCGISIVQGFKEFDIHPDVLYLYVSAPFGQTDNYLYQMLGYWRENGPHPTLQCVLENFFGARYHFSLEQCGARITYSRTINAGRDYSTFSQDRGLTADGHTLGGIRK
jgi:hypothetical protein